MVVSRALKRGTKYLRVSVPKILDVNDHITYLALSSLNWMCLKPVTIALLNCSSMLIAP